MTPKIPPPLQTAFWAVIIWALYKLVPALQFKVAGQTLIAILFAACGIVLDLVSVFNFFKAKTTVNPLRPERASALVVAGFYRFTRNPMYLGMVLVLVGWGIYLGSPLAIIGVVGFILVMNHIQIKPEEAAMEAQFGQDYLKYKNTVRRWV